MDTRQETLNGLRDLVAFLESHPEAPLPYLGALNAFVETKEELTDAARHIGGTLHKEASDTWYFLKRSFGPINYHINIEREKVCEKVVIGTKTVHAQPERVIPATPETVEEITEWRCSEVLR